VAEPVAWQGRKLIRYATDPQGSPLEAWCEWEPVELCGDARSWFTMCKEDPEHYEVRPLYLAPGVGVGGGGQGKEQP
jgi:hypothetical protein